jgi:4-aminobutyrate aminotransferase-like enzyme
VAGVIVRRELAERFSATGMEYFNTTGGNSVACVVANTVLNIIERDNLQQRGLEMGSYLINKFNEMKTRHKSIGDVRGQGLFLGVELVADPKLRIPDGLLAKEVCKRARYKGVLLSKDGPDENVIKIKPPMTFTEQDAQLLLTTFEESLIEASR